jgi:DNA-binding MarR family transcriptional regulator
MTSPPDAGPPEGSAVGWLLMRFSTQMHAASSRFAVRRELHPTDVTAMAVLAAAPRPLTAGELAAELELSSGATTRLVDRLERVGHLAREVDPEDARRRLVSVTPTARATAGAYFGQLGDRVDEVFATFDADEQAVITRFLDALVTEMDTLPEA